MRFFNWAEAFKETPTCDDILARVRRTEITYWIFLVISVLIVIGGATAIREATEGDIKEHAWGLFVAIVGIVNVAVMKLWAHIRLTTYFIIWDRQNRIEAEIKKLESHDL